MTIQAIPLPELGSYSGSELMMQAQGFTLDGLGLLTELSYLDNGQLRHAAWIYDLAERAYTTSINASISTALGLDSQDLTQVEVHDVQAFASAGQRGVAALYSRPGVDDVAHIALLVGNSVTVVDVLTGATSPDASHAIRRFAISEDGRFVALQTSADLSSDTDLMAGMADVNEADDIYLLDRDTQKITRVSVVAGDAPLVPSQLGDIAVRNGLVQISFVSEAAFTAQDSNANTNDAIDAYLWSQSFSPTGLIGQSTLSLLSGSGNSAIGGMSVASDGQPEFAGPLITAEGTYFNSSSAQLANADQNESADVFIYRNAQAQRLTWTGQPMLDFGATVIGTSSNGQIAGLLSSSSAVSGSYGGTQLLVIDTASGNSTVLPTGTSTAADGSIVSAAMSPNGAWAAFTWNAISPLVGSESLPEGTLYLADTGFRVDAAATGSPVISPVATEGQSISANTTAISDTDGAITLAYQWQRSDNASTWTNIANAIASSYNIAADQSEVGKYLRLRVLSTDALGGNTELFSEARQVANVNDSPTGSVTFSGTPAQGQVLTAGNTLGDIDGLGTISYQWMTNGSAINGATSSTFLITPNQAGQQISVLASYTDLQGTAESVESASLKINTPPVARDNSYNITEDDTQVLGNLITDGWAPGTVGETLFRDTDADGDTLSISAITVGGVLTVWADLPKSTDPADLADAQRGIEWKAIALPNGTAWLQSTGELRYAGKANDMLGDTLGYTISDVQGGTASAQVQIKVLPVDDPSTATLSISGSAKTGESLSLRVSNITDADGTPSLAYQWQWMNNQTWQDIDGATSDTWGIPTGGLWAERAVRAQLSTTDPLGGASVFHSDAQTIEASSQLVLGAAHWKTGKALTGVGVGLYDGATELKTGSDGTLSAQSVQDPDGMDDGQTVLNPTLAADPKQASITLTDVLSALKVYLGKPLPEAYNNDLKFIAADFDGNGSVNLTDVLGLLKFYLNKPVNAAPAWVFVDSMQTTTVNGQMLHWSSKADQTLSTTASAPSPILVDLNSDESVQLLGVLRGDVDGSWVG